jgi:hypothetical protein
VRTVWWSPSGMSDYGRCETLLGLLPWRLLETVPVTHATRNARGCACVRSLRILIFAEADR